MRVSDEDFVYYLPCYSILLINSSSLIFFLYSMSVTASLATIVVITPWFGVALIPILLFYFKVLNYFREVSRETKRLEVRQKNFFMSSADSIKYLFCTFFLLQIGNISISMLFSFFWDVGKLKNVVSLLMHCFPCFVYSAT